MKLLLLSIVAICITGIRSQEIAIGTDYLRAHINDSISSISGRSTTINAQVIEDPPAQAIIIFNPEPSSSSTTTTTTTTTLSSQVDDNVNESPVAEQTDNIQNTNYDHHHKSHHHQHKATITVDLQNILDLFKQQLKETEKNILTAIQQNPPSNAVPILKSYRTSDRQNEIKNK